MQNAKELQLPTDLGRLHWFAERSTRNRWKPHRRCQRRLDRRDVYRVFDLGCALDLDGFVQYAVERSLGGWLVALILAIAGGWPLRFAERDQIRSGADAPAAVKRNLTCQIRSKAAS
jgi:hypothetical protein